MVARRIDEGREFVASSDIWFRPAQFANAPDGTLYIIDVYREVIEHPASLPPEIKQHLDLTSGRDRGRIYRVCPTDSNCPRAATRSGLDGGKLVATLAHPNGWHRDTAARLLFEGRVSGRRSRRWPIWLTTAVRPWVGWHARTPWPGSTRFNAPRVLAALADPDARVRRCGAPG